MELKNNESDRLSPTLLTENLDVKNCKENNTEDQWSAENAKLATAAFKDEIKTLVEKLQCEKEDSGILLKMQELCTLIGLTANKQYATSNEDEANFYEKLLDAPMELKIQDLVCNYLKSCVNEHHADHNDLILPSKIELLTLCVSILAHIASGSSEQTEAVKVSGVCHYYEKFALQKDHTYLSFYSLKLIVCFMSEDRNFASEISKNIDYFVRVCELNSLADLDISEKGWLIFFLDWAFHSMEERESFDKSVLNTCFAAACSYVHTDEFFLLDKSMNLLRTLFEKEYMERKVTRDSPVYTVIVQILPRLVSLLSSPYRAISDEAMMVLGNILREDENYFAINRYKEKLLHVTVHTGILNHLPGLLISDSTVVLERVLWLISIFAVNEQKLLFRMESFYTLLPYICYHLRSKHYLVVSRGFFALYNILQFPYRDVEDKPDEDYIENHPEVLHSVLAALKNVNELGKEASLYSLDEDEHPVSTILDYGLRCFEFIIALGYDEEDEDDMNKDIAEMCSDAIVFETFVFLRSVDVNKYDENRKLDLEDRVKHMRRMLKLSLESNKICVSDDMGIFDDLLPDD